MNKSQYQVLNKALASISSIKLDIYNSRDSVLNFDAVGRAVLIQRRLAELLNLDLSDYLLPGEYIDDELEIEPMFYTIKNTYSEDLSIAEQQELTEIFEILTDGLPGLTDTDMACYRCARRAIAEVLGLDLSKYPMLGASSKPIYYSEYKQKI